MKRGTTPTLTFGVDIPTANISVLNVALSQNGNVVIEKVLGDCDVTDNEIAVTLTEDETLKLKDGYVQMQIRVYMADGKKLASNIMSTTVDKILKDGVL